jgi:hypothetical protein
MGGKIEFKNGISKSIHFKDNSTVVVTDVTHGGEGEPKITRRGDEANSPLWLRAIFLDVATGQVTATRNWPSDSRAGYVVATTEGRIVTQTGDNLTLYDEELQKIASIKLPPSSPSVEWAVHPSLTGKSILLSLIHPELKPKLLSWKWLETGTFKLTRSWDGQPVGNISITDGEIAISTGCERLDCEKLQIRGLDSDWKMIGPGGGEATFVSEDMLYLRGFPNWNSPARLVRINGETIFVENEPSELGIPEGRPVVASEAERFVVPSLRTEGAHPSLDVDGHIVLKGFSVYDLTSPTQPHRFAVKGPTIKDDMAFAISPNGSKVAVLCNQAVEVFNLPLP